MPQECGALKTTLKCKCFQRELKVQLRQSGVLRQQHVRPQHRVHRVLLQLRHDFFKVVNNVANLLWPTG